MLADINGTFKTIIWQETKMRVKETEVSESSLDSNHSMLSEQMHDLRDRQSKITFSRTYRNKSEFF